MIKHLDSLEGEVKRGVRLGRIHIWKLDATKWRRLLQVMAKSEGEHITVNWGSDGVAILSKTHSILWVRE